MKIKLLILSFLLVLSVPSFACFEGDDTDWDIDGGELDDVEIIGDSYWYIDDMDDYDYDNDDDDDDYSWDDYDDDDDDTVYGVNSFNYFRKSYSPKDGDVLVKKDLPKKWTKQDKNTTCVVTAMEYAAKILTGMDAYSRFYFADMYQSLFGLDVRNSGVNINNLDQFFNEVLYVSVIDAVYSFYNAIDSGYCVLSILDEGYTAHEIVIVGYTNDKADFIGIDPWDGNSKKYNYYELKGINYVVRGIR